MDEAFRQIISEIVDSMKAAGYNAHDQLTGYLQTGSLRYITRKNGAREKIASLDKAMIRDYLKFSHRSPDVQPFQAPKEIAIGA